MGNMHIVLKYNDQLYNVDTIEEHQKVINNERKVIWGIIKLHENSPGISSEKINKLKEQIKNSIETYAFLATKGEIKAKCIVEDIYTKDEVQSNSKFVPKYYRNDLNKCVGGVVINNIESVDSNIIKELKRYDSENEEIFLSSQANPMYVEYKKETVKKINADINNNKVVKGVNNINSDDMDKNKNKDILKKIEDFIKFQGFKYDDNLVKNFYLCLKTKPFVILAGISGTGKSKLVKLFAEALGATSENGRYKLVPVKPDWSDATDLIGYRDLNGKFHAGVLINFIKKAIEDKTKPYFLCLDEMNLARVEYYFSDILSIMETRKKQNDEIVTDKLILNEMFGDDKEAYNNYKDIYIPENLYIVGTVNMDETTFPFSKKVLDRANTIEFSYVDLDFNISSQTEIKPIEVGNEFLKSDFIILDDCMEYEEVILKIILILIEINEVLVSANLNFGYRIRDEICFYIIYNHINNLMEFDEAMDLQILQKILPRIQGSSMSIKKVLIDLYKICRNNKIGDLSYDEVDINKKMFDELSKEKEIPYKKSAYKIAVMVRRFEEDGFTSYWM